METTERGNASSTAGIAHEPVSTLNKASSNVHVAVDSLAGAAGEAARKAEPAIDRVAAVAHQVVNTAASAVAPSADWLKDQGATLQAAQKKLVADTCNYVSANPLKAVGMAVVAGMVLGRVIGVFRGDRRARPSP